MSCVKHQFNSDRDGREDIYVMAADGNDQHKLTDDDAWDDNPVWSPDGTEIAFSSDRSGAPGLWLMNADGSDVRAIVDDGAMKVGVPAWSADGARLLFHAAVAGE